MQVCDPFVWTQLNILSVISQNQDLLKEDFRNNNNNNNNSNEPYNILNLSYLYNVHLECHCCVYQIDHTTCMNLELIKLTNKQLD